MKTIFTIQLVQDDAGISVLSGAVGQHPEVFDIGIEILANLKVASETHPQMNIRVDHLQFTDRMQ
jgi:hypothetical protein